MAGYLLEARAYRFHVCVAWGALPTLELHSTSWTVDFTFSPLSMNVEFKRPRLEVLGTENETYFYTSKVFI